MRGEGGHIEGVLEGEHNHGAVLRAQLQLHTAHPGGHNRLAVGHPHHHLGRPKSLKEGAREEDMVSSTAIHQDSAHLFILLCLF